MIKCLVDGTTHKTYRSFVKDFHIWFRKEIEDGLKKYIEIEQWCTRNNFHFLFWFKSIGYKTIDEILKIYGRTQNKK
jgi:hypothetical protein